MFSFFLAIIGLLGGVPMEKDYLYSLESIQRATGGLPLTRVGGGSCYTADTVVCLYFLPLGYLNSYLHSGVSFLPWG